MVSPATFRHPSELATVVATADHVSGGRVELGLGAGWHEEEHRRFGFPFPPLRERMDVLAEQLEIVHRTWTEGPFSFAGEHYRLEGCDAQPRPVQSPHPPLIMGGSARPRGAALAARWADEYNTPFASVDEVRERRRAPARGVRGGGPRADPAVADDRRHRRARPRGGAREGGGARRLPRRRLRRRQHADRRDAARRDGRGGRGAAARLPRGRRAPRDAPAPAAHRPRARSS